MAERARKLMSAAEFLEWDDGTDTRYELIDGVPVAMAPGSAQSHADFLQRGPGGRRCRARPKALPGRSGRRAAAGGRTAGPCLHPGRCSSPVSRSRRSSLRGPARLVVEVLSPSTQATTRPPSCRAMPPCARSRRSGSSARGHGPGLWQRLAEWRDGLPMIGRATFASRVLGIEVSLDAVYELTTLASAEDGAEEAGA